MANYENASGLKPIPRDDVYKIHIAEAEKFINDLMEVAVDEFNSAEAEKNKDSGETFTPEEYIHCTLQVCAGVSKNKKFFPIVLLMPVSADSERKAKPSVEGELSMFRENGVDTKRVTVKNYINKIISSFQYREENSNKPSFDVFKDMDLRKSAAVNSIKVDTLTSLIVPRIVDVGDELNIGVVIDPLRLFSMMLSTSKKKIRVSIQSVTKVDKDNYFFIVSTMRNDKNNKKKHKNKSEKGVSELSGIISDSLK